MVDRNAGIIEQTRQLLEPGEIDLVGTIVHTECGPREETEMFDLTVDIGKTIADHLVEEPTYIYSGNDDPTFASTQHQGLTIDGDDFVWECQQLLRDDTFDIVFYYERSTEHRAIIEALRSRGLEVTSVTD